MEEKQLLLVIEHLYSALREMLLITDESMCDNEKVKRAREVIVEVDSMEPTW